MAWKLTHEQSYTNVEHIGIGEAFSLSNRPVGHLFPYIYVVLRNHSDRDEILIDSVDNWTPGVPLFLPGTTRSPLSVSRSMGVYKSTFIWVPT